MILLNFECNLVVLESHLIWLISLENQVFVYCRCIREMKNCQAALSPTIFSSAPQGFKYGHFYLFEFLIYLFSGNCCNFFWDGNIYQSKPKQIVNFPENCGKLCISVYASLTFTEAKTMTNILLPYHIFNTIRYMIFQYDWEPVVIQTILIGLEAITENLLFVHFSIMK